MRLSLTALVSAALSLSLQVAQAQPARDQLYRMGDSICRRVLGEGIEGIDNGSYRAAVAAENWGQDSYCHCVAEEFAVDIDDRFGVTTAAPAREAEAMAVKIDDALSTCLSSDGDLADEPEIESLSYDDNDVRMCRMALDGGFMVPGFNETAVLTQIASSGQTTDDLCSCAAMHISAGGEPLQREIESAANPTIAYASTLAGGINGCLL